jgi:pectate lyase
MKKATTTTRHNPKPYVVVTNAGTDSEHIWSDHATYEAAVRETTNAKHSEGSADVMKRLDNGTLTTEV